MATDPVHANKIWNFPSSCLIKYLWNGTGGPLGDATMVLFDFLPEAEFFLDKFSLMGIGWAGGLTGGGDGVRTLESLLISNL